MIPVSLILAGGIAVAGAGAAWYVMDLRSDYAECKTAKDLLTERIREQNKAIETIAAKGKKTTARLDAALLATAPAAKAAETRVAQRKSVPAPKSCDAAFDLLDSEK